MCVGSVCTQPPYNDKNPPSFFFKGALCRILTLLKHKNTIICLQIFKKHAKLTYLFIWKTMLQSVILLWKCAFRPGMSVFVMVCETRPLPVYPIVFQHAGLPVGRKHSVFNFIHLHVVLLVSLNWQPACVSSLRRRGWWKKRLQYFEFGRQYLLQPLGVNPTYSTFKIQINNIPFSNQAVLRFLAVWRHTDPGPSHDCWLTRPSYLRPALSELLWVRHCFDARADVDKNVS